MYFYCYSFLSTVARLQMLQLRRRPRKGWGWSGKSRSARAREWVLVPVRVRTLYWRWEVVNRAAGAGDSGRVGVVKCGVRVRFDPLDFGEKGVQRNSLASIWSIVASMLWLYEVLGCKKSVINSPDSKEEFKELVIKSITYSEEVEWNWTLIL